MDTVTLAQGLLLYAILPLWVVAGVGDYLCHRASQISTTSGVKEALIHWLMLVEIGVPILLGLFFEVNALILLIMLIGLIVHYATGLWDLYYAYESPRAITPLEQHIHSYQEMLPITGFAMIVLINWEQFLALLGGGNQAADFTLRYKSILWESGYAPVMLAVIFCCVILPYGEELLRCVRARKHVYR
jgi:hypothetical protein